MITLQAIPMIIQQAIPMTILQAIPPIEVINCKPYTVNQRKE